jgi:hypothetical protein
VPLRRPPKLESPRVVIGRKVGNRAGFLRFRIHHRIRAADEPEDRRYVPFGSQIDSMVTGVWLYGFVPGNKKL